MFVVFAPDIVLVAVDNHVRLPKSAVFAMHHRLIPKLHRHSLKLAASRAVNIDCRCCIDKFFYLFFIKQHTISTILENVNSCFRDSEFEIVSVNQPHSSITSSP